jgi:hypothetical protein
MVDWELEEVHPSHYLTILWGILVNTNGYKHD